MCRWASQDVSRDDVCVRGDSSCRGTYRAAEGDCIGGDAELEAWGRWYVRSCLGAVNCSHQTFEGDHGRRSYHLGAKSLIYTLVVGKVMLHEGSGRSGFRSRGKRAVE